MSEEDVPIFEIETLGPPIKYTALQIASAAHLAAFLGRGKLVLCEPPELEH